MWPSSWPAAPLARRLSERSGGSQAGGEIEALLEEGRERIPRLSKREFLIAGAALYAREGCKTDGDVGFANSDPRMMAFFCAWLRRFFDVDESRLRLRSTSTKVSTSTKRTSSGLRSPGSP